MSPTAVGSAAGAGRLSGLQGVGLVSLLGENLGMEFGFGFGLEVGLGLLRKQRDEESEAE